MKKLYIIFLCLCTLFSLVSCTPNKLEEKECYVSSPSLVYGDRIYQIGDAKDANGKSRSYLTYTNIGDETGNTYIGCVDPLCTHEYQVCSAVAYGLSEIVMVSGRKAPKIYFFGYSDNNERALICLDMKTGNREVLCEITMDFRFYNLTSDFIISDGYLYLNGRLRNGDVESSYSSNIWRIPLSGGELEQITNIENGYCTLYHCDTKGFFYYFHRDYENDTSFIARSKDFIHEELLLDVGITKEYPKVYGQEFHFYDGMMYYPVATAPMEYAVLDKPIGYGAYDEGYYIAVGYLSWYRIPLDGSAEPELVAENIYCGLAESSIAFANGKLYCIPRKDKLVGTIEWLDKNSITGIPEEDAKKNKSKLWLCYIWSVNGGRIWEIDLNTLAKKEIAIDENADVHAIYSATEDHVILHIKSTDLDVISENFGGSYTTWGSDMPYTNIIALELD